MLGDIFGIMMIEFKLIISEFSKRVEMGGEQFTKEEADNIQKKKEKGGQDTSEWIKHSKLFK